MNLILAVFVLIILVGFAYWGTTTLVKAYELPAKVSAPIIVFVVFLLLYLVLNTFGLWPGNDLRLPR